MANSYPDDAAGQRDVDPCATSPETIDDPNAPAGLPLRIGRYGVDRLLGHGGFGLVYLAHDEQLNRRVAIKVPHAKLFLGTVARPAGPRRTARQHPLLEDTDRNSSR